MKVITIVNNKGGVGKTTSAQNIGAGLAKYGGGKVLMIDLDTQANLTKCFKIQISEIKKNSGSFILNEYPIDDLIYSIGNIDLLPSTLDLLNKEDTIKASPVYPFNLKIALDKVKEKYNYVIIDCPPALSGMTRIALISCDMYFVPLQAEFLSYEGLRNFLQYTNEIKIISPTTTLGGVFATRYNPKVKKKISNDIIEAAKEQLGVGFLNTNIRESIALSEAQAKGLNIFDYEPESNGAIDYYNLTKEILEKIN